MIETIAALLLVGSSEVPDPAATMLSALRSRVAVELVNLDAVRLAGRYQVPPAGVGGLAGAQLHLFPDGTYVYCEWADIWPLTVHDKGRWKATSGLLELESDPDITWGPGADRRYLVFRRSSQATEILLIGLGRDLRILDQVDIPKDDDRFVLWLSLSRGAVYNHQRGAGKAKAELMRRAWRPEAFRDEP